MENQTDYREGVEKDDPIPAIGIIGIIASRDVTNNLGNRTELKNGRSNQYHRHGYADQRDEEDLPSLQRHELVTQ